MHPSGAYGKIKGQNLGEFKNDFVFCKKKKKEFRKSIFSSMQYKSIIKKNGW